MIDVRVPYCTDQNLGRAYNEIIRTSTKNWILLLDHDIFLALNHKWYEICMHTIQTHNPALATCWTGRDGSALSWIAYQESPVSKDIGEHAKTAQEVYEKYGLSVSPVEKVTGFFMLINKDSWAEVGGFPAKGMASEDWDYSDRLNKAGKKIVRMDGLYVYHNKSRTWLGSNENFV